MSPKRLKTDELIEKSQWLRKEIFDIVVTPQRGHIPSCYSCCEIVLSLFYGANFKCDAKNVHWVDRDRIFISKGHAAMVLYPIFADFGFFSPDELKRFAKKDGLLRMYADQSIPGFESTTGSLGHGLGIGCGHALSGKLDGRDFRTFVVLGDGECYEGSVWEAAMFAAHHKLDNFVVFVDRNELCILDATEKCLRIDPLADKWKSFGWETYEIDGHTYKDLLETLDHIEKNKRNGKPKVVIANTIKGKGISFMEGRPDWHNRMMNTEQVSRAREELEQNCIHG